MPTESQVLGKTSTHATPPPRLIDTHAHLDDGKFDLDRDAVVARANAANVDVILMCTRMEDFERTVSLAGQTRFRCALGVHPNAAGHVDHTLEVRLEAFAKSPATVAIGEIGLDYYRDHTPHDVQQKVLRRQLTLARELDLPVVVHNRDATADLLSLLKEFPGVRGVFHCFVGDHTEANAMLDLGFFLGIGGPLTFKKNEALRQTLRDLPLERLLVETDSPYLTPTPHRGKRNEPAYVRHVAQSLAEIRALPLNEVAEQTSVNAQRLFGV